MPRKNWQNKGQVVHHSTRTRRSGYGLKRCARIDYHEGLSMKPAREEMDERERQWFDSQTKRRHERRDHFWRGEIGNDPVFRLILGAFKSALNDHGGNYRGLGASVAKRATQQLRAAMREQGIVLPPAWLRPTEPARPAPPDGGE